MPPSKRKSIMTNEERIARLKESRLKYSQIGKAKTAGKISDKKSAAGKPPSISKPQATTEKDKPSKHPAPNDDFEIDPSSMDMIKSGNVRIPSARPSITSRSTIGGPRPSITGRAQQQNNNRAQKGGVSGISRPRASISTMPRESLMPLGINIFEATEYQKHQLSDYFNSQMGSSQADDTKLSNSSFTPGRKILSSVTTDASFSAITRQKRIRFMENSIPEQRESVDAEDIATTSSIRHSPIRDVSFVPSSILSSKKLDSRKKVKLGPIFSPTAPSITNGSNTSQEVKQLMDAQKVAEAWIESDKQIDEEEQEILKGLVEKLNQILTRQVMKESLNATIPDPSHLSCLGGGAYAVKTPKAIKMFRAQEQEAPLPPLNEVLKSIMSTEDTPSPDEPEDRKPAAKRNRRSGFMSTKSERPVLARSLFTRRSIRLSGVKQSSTADD